MFLSMFLVGLGLRPIGAQDQAGGNTWRLGVSQDFRARTNPGLNSPSDSTEYLATTDLGIGFQSQTRVDSFNLNASGGLQVSSQDDSRLLSDPSISFGYQRQNHSLEMGITAFANERRLTERDLIEEELDGGLIEGTFVESRVTRRRYGGSGQLTFGRDGPFGGTVSFGQTNTRYSDTINPDLVDSERRTAGLSLRFDISPVFSLTPGVSVTQLDEEGNDRRQTETYSLGASLDRPDGSYSVTVSSAQTPEGGRNEITLGRSLVLPRGTLSGQAGMSRSPDGSSNVVGGVSWTEDLPNGDLTVGLTRSVSGDARDRETVSTRLNVGTSQVFSPLLTGQARLGVSENKRVDNGDTTRSLILAASVRYSLTQDWGLRAGADHRIRRADDTTASSTAVFLTLDREFLARN